jgi:hypothetical protein
MFSYNIIILLLVYVIFCDYNVNKTWSQEFYRSNAHLYYNYIKQLYFSSLGIPVVNPWIWGYDRAYARSSPQIRGSLRR